MWLLQSESMTEYAWSLPIHPEHNPLSPNAAGTSHQLWVLLLEWKWIYISSHCTQTHRRIQHGLPALDTCYTLRTELHTCALIKTQVSLLQSVWRDRKH